MFCRPQGPFFLPKPLREASSWPEMASSDLSAPPGGSRCPDRGPKRADRGHFSSSFEAVSKDFPVQRRFGSPGNHSLLTWSSTLSCEDPGARPPGMLQGSSRDPGSSWFFGFFLDFPMVFLQIPMLTARFARPRSLRSLSPLAVMASHGQSIHALGAGF